MREQLASYVELLFAGTSGCEDMKQEILQNTLERYDDLIAQGKAPEAAYRLSISGIGDINELLGNETVPCSTAAPVKPQGSSVAGRILKAFAIFLYIISPIPLFVLEMMNMEEIGLCGTLAICGVATALLIVAGSVSRQPKAKPDQKQEKPKTEDSLYKAISALIVTLGIVGYFVISFWSGAWYITWVIFPLVGAVKGLINAIFDVVEAEK